MSEQNMIRVKRLDDGTIVQILPDGSTQVLEDTSDWARFDAMTEEEAEANAIADPDNPPLSDKELTQFRPIPNPKEIRKRLRLTQEQFALRFRLPLETLRDWEQGVRIPDRAARNYLRVIDKNPDAVLEALEEV